jgi:PqqD family protein of HPr-rel-A system
MARRRLAILATLRGLSYDPEELKALALSETGFVFDPRTGHSYSLNPTGLAILAAMKEGLAATAIADRLRARFDGGAAIEDDVDAFVELLRELGIVARPRDKAT